MAYIPKTTKWFIAEIIEEIKMKGDKSDIHVNYVLIAANDPEIAYQKAMKLGKEGEHTFENSRGEVGEFVFRGLRDLHVVHDELEHGGELFYDWYTDYDELDIEKLIKSKENLSVFRSDK